MYKTVFKDNPGVSYLLLSMNFKIVGNWLRPIGENIQNYLLSAKNSAIVGKIIKIGYTLPTIAMKTQNSR